ncbi:protein-tyrosine kinase [Viscerimonas tarda]
MERGKITISENGVKITPANGNVWLSEWQIAELFGVFVAKVSSNVRSILKSEVLRESEVVYCEHYANGGSVDLYSLEMITALAFRIKSKNSEIFRSWLMKRACSKSFFLMEQLFDERKMCLN